MNTSFQILKRDSKAIFAIAISCLVLSSTAFAAHTIDLAVDDGEAITITGSNNIIGVDDAGANCDAILSATLTAGTYTPTELAAHIKTQVDLQLTDAVTVTYNYETRLFSVTGDAGDSACWANATTTAETALGYDATDDNNISTPSVSDTALSIGDRIYATGAAGSDTTMIEFRFDVSGGADSVNLITITPPSGWNITGWNLFNDDDGDDAADATDTPDMDGNAGNSTGCGDANSTTVDTAAITNCSSEVTGNGTNTLQLDLETVVASGQIVILQLYVDAASGAGLSGTWTAQTTDDNGSPASQSETFNTVAADNGDIVFEIYTQGDALDGDISTAASGDAYIFDPDATNIAITSFSTIKKTLSSGMAIYEDGTEFTSPGGANGTFDYAITGTDQSKIGDDITYDFDGITIVRDDRDADTTDTDISAATVNQSGGKNIMQFTLTEPLIYDTLITDSDRSLASVAALGDTTATATGLVFTGIGEWTDTDGQPNTTNQTGGNTVAIDDTLRIITVTSNDQSTASDPFYYTNTAAGAAADATSDDFTPATGIIKDAAGNDTDTTAIGTGAITVTSGWDVTPVTAATNLERIGSTATADQFRWTATTDPGDFDSYFFLYDTSTITAATASNEWDQSDDGNFSVVATTNTDITGLSTGTSYFGRLGALDTAGNLGLSNEVTFTSSAGGLEPPDSVKPDDPTNFTISVNENLEVVMTWVDPTAADLDVVHVRKSSDGLNFFLQGIIAKGVQTYTDSNVTEGETVYYRLQGIDLSGNNSDGGMILEITVQSGAAVEEPPPPIEETETTEEGGAEEGTGEETVLPGEDPEPTFTDIAGHWAELVIEDMAAKNVVKGNPDGTFLPDNPLNRAEAAALFYRVLWSTEPLPPSEAPFSDITDLTAWYAGYLSVLKEMELISGNPDGTYLPGVDINRAEYLTLALNVYYYLVDDSKKAEIDALKTGPMTTAYQDLADDWYTENVTAATELGFIQGRECQGGKCFDANSNITRAEATAILHNMFFDLI